MFRSAIERAGLQLRGRVRGPGEPVYVDRDMWEKIVLNLLSNAFKFTLQGRIAVRLRREDVRAPCWRSPIPASASREHELPRLFERFHRVEGAQGRTQEGTGIGLALVQELVKLHGGVDRGQSELGSGTTFRCRLPFGTAPPAARAHQARPRTLAATALGAQAFVQEALRWLPDDAGTTRMQPAR